MECDLESLPRKAPTKLPNRASVKMNMISTERECIQAQDINCWLNTGVSVREAHIDTVIVLLPLQGAGVQRLLVPSDVPLVVD